MEISIQLPQEFLDNIKNEVHMKKLNSKLFYNIRETIPMPLMNIICED